MDQAGIYNTALGRVGSGETVLAPTDRTVAAQTCNRFYNSCRQEVMRAFPWPCAMRSVALALVADETFPGWTYVYDLPDDCLRVRAVTDEAGLRGYRSWSVFGGLRNTDLPEFREPWQIALRADGERSVILSDVASAYAIFTYDLTNTGAFTIDLASVIAWRLAMEIGGPMQARRDLIDRAESRYDVWYSRASATALNEGRDDPVRESASITCRE